MPLEPGKTNIGQSRQASATRKKAAGIPLTPQEAGTTAPSGFLTGTPIRNARPGIVFSGFGSSDIPTSYRAPPSQADLTTIVDAPEGAITAAIAAQKIDQESAIFTPAQTTSMISRAQAQEQEGKISRFLADDLPQTDPRTQGLIKTRAEQTGLTGQVTTPLLIGAAASAPVVGAVAGGAFGLSAGLFATGLMAPPVFAEAQRTYQGGTGLSRGQEQRAAQEGFNQANRWVQRQSQVNQVLYDWAPGTQMAPDYRREFESGVTQYLVKTGVPLSEAKRYSQRLANVETTARGAGVAVGTLFGEAGSETLGRQIFSKSAAKLTAMQGAKQLTVKESKNLATKAGFYALTPAGAAEGIFQYQLNEPARGRKTTSQGYVASGIFGATTANVFGLPIIRGSVPTPGLGTKAIKGAAYSLDIAEKPGDVFADFLGQRLGVGLGGQRLPIFTATPALSNTLGFSNVENSIYAPSNTPNNVPADLFTEEAPAIKSNVKTSIYEPSNTTNNFPINPFIDTPVQNQSDVFEFRSPTNVPTEITENINESVTTNVPSNVPTNVMAFSPVVSAPGFFPPFLGGPFGSGGRGGGGGGKRRRYVDEFAAAMAAAGSLGLAGPMQRQKKLKPNMVTIGGQKYKLKKVKGKK